MITRPYFYIELCQVDDDDNITALFETFTKGYATPMEVPVGKYVLRLKVEHATSDRPLPQHCAFKYSGTEDFGCSLTFSLSHGTLFELIEDRYGLGNPKQTRHNGYNFDSVNGLILLDEFEVTAGQKEHIVILANLDLGFTTASRIEKINLSSLSVEFTIRGKPETLY